MIYDVDEKKLEVLLRKKFFFGPSAHIYGGVSGLYDYGPLGCSLKNALMELWRGEFVKKESLFEVDTSILLPYEVLKASGHVDKFSDLLVFDKETGEFYRADHVIKGRLSERQATDETKEVLEGLEGLSVRECESIISRLGIKSDRGNDLVGAAEFNLIFKTSIGPKARSPSFLRPETAQGQFLNFRKLYELNYEKLPFGSATIGRVFRNEISPRTGLLRVREFDQAEIEYFVDPLDKRHSGFGSVSDMEVTLKPRGTASPAKYPGRVNEDGCTRMKLSDAVACGMIDSETLAYFVGKTHLFLLKLGIRDEYLRFRQHNEDEMAHYACDCWDAEILTSYGWIECVGIADRSGYDLKVHQSFSKSSLSARRILEKPQEMLRWYPVINRQVLGRELKGELPSFLSRVEALIEDKDANSADTEPTETESSMDVEFGGRLYTLKVERKKVKTTTEEFVPHIIEPSFGIGRIMYSLCEHVYWKRDDERGVLSFKPWIAPVQCEVSFLAKNAALEALVDVVMQSLEDVRASANRRSVSIGKKYSIADESGIPFYVTIDFVSLKDSSVTVRERDTMQQIRIRIEKLGGVISELACGKKAWKLVKKMYEE